METYKIVTTRHSLKGHSLKVLVPFDNYRAIEKALETKFGFAPDHIRKALAVNIWLNLTVTRHADAENKWFTLTWGTVEIARALADLDRQLKSAYTHLHEFEARRQRLGFASDLAFDAAREKGSR